MLGRPKFSLPPSTHLGSHMHGKLEEFMSEAWFLS
jgi:hypothetical protein